MEPYRKDDLKVETVNNAESAAPPQQRTAEQVAESRGAVRYETPERPKDMDGVLKYLNDEIERGKPETPDEKRKRERREKWQGIISGISDAVSSLGNLYFTTQYAPNMYDADKGMGAKARERREKAKAERDKEYDRWLNLALKRGELQDRRYQQDVANSHFDVQFNQNRVNADRQYLLNAAKDRRDAARADIELKLKNKEIDIKDAELLIKKAEQEYKEAQAKYADKRFQSEIDKNRAQTASAEAAATEHNARANEIRRYGTGGRGSGAYEFEAYDENGKAYRFKTEAAAIYFAKQHGTYVPHEQESETSVDEGFGLPKKTKRKSQGKGVSRRPTTANPPRSERQGGGKTNHKSNPFG